MRLQQAHSTTNTCRTIELSSLWWAIPSRKDLEAKTLLKSLTRRSLPTCLGMTQYMMSEILVRQEELWWKMETFHTGMNRNIKTLLLPKLTTLSSCSAPTMPSTSSTTKPQSSTTTCSWFSHSKPWPHHQRFSSWFLHRCTSTTHMV